MQARHLMIPPQEEFNFLQPTPEYLARSINIMKTAPTLLDTSLKTDLSELRTETSTDLYPENMAMLTQMAKPKSLVSFTSRFLLNPKLFVE